MDGWLPGESNHYDQGESCLDLAHLAAFLASTQPETASALSLDQDTPTRRQFLARVKSQIDSRGIIDVLRNGVNHQQHSITLFYGSPSPGNTQASRTPPPEPLLSDPAVALQQRQQAAGPGPGSLHQRPAHRHHGAKEQSHQADGSRRGRAISQHPEPEGTPLPHRPLRRPLRGGRPRSQVLHRAGRQAVVIPALQQGLQRRRRQPGQPRRHQDVLPLAGNPESGQPDRHHRELRPEGRQPADLAPLPPTGPGTPTPG